MNQRTISINLAVLALAAVSSAQDWDPIPLGKKPVRTNQNSTFAEVIRRVSGMTDDPRASALVRRQGLDLINLTWEDTGRYKGSAVGPNISDMTIQVATETRRGYEVSAMPVIRFPNFSDKTGDINPDDFTLLVGNHRPGRRGELQRVSLLDVLANPTSFMTNPESWPSRRPTLLADRDTHVLVSAQACFLPIPKQGVATFNPVLFNYQSFEKNPAVLTILATREGTSMTVIDNKRDSLNYGAVWGQRLFFNNHGQRTSLTGERLSDFQNDPKNAGKGGSGLNMVLLIQVPLKQRETRREFGGYGGGAMDSAKAAAPAGRRGSDVENAVIGHGDNEGPFTEMDNLPIERDPRYPVRVTVQFYKATSTGQISEADVREIKDQINQIYGHADNVGSLVTDGKTGRPTEYWGMKVQPASWWQQFWTRYEANTHQSRESAMRQLGRLLGDYRDKPVCSLYLRDLLDRNR